MGENLNSKLLRHLFDAITVILVLVVVLLVHLAHADSAGLLPFIRRDGLTTTTARIPFQEGISLPIGDINDLAIKLSSADIGIYYPDNATMRIAGRTTGGGVMTDIIDFITSTSFTDIQVGAIFLRPKIAHATALGTNGQPFSTLVAGSVTLLSSSGSVDAEINMQRSGLNTFQLEATASNVFNIKTTSGAFTQAYLSINNTTAAVNLNTASAGGTTTIGRATQSVLLQGNTTLSALTGPGILSVDASEVVGIAVSGTDYIASISVTSPITSTGGGSPTIGFDWSTTGTVMLKTDAGTTTFYKPSADTDAARGTALESAIAAHAAGDLIYVGPGDYEMSGSFALEAGVSLIGIGQPLLYTDALTTKPLIRLINNNITVQNLDLETNGAGLGEFDSKSIAVSGIKIRNVNHAPIAGAVSNVSGLQFSETIGGGNVEHTVEIDVWDSKLYGGTTTGYGVHVSMDSDSVVNLWNCDVYGATDGILNKNVGGTSTGVTNIYGGKYASVLDAITSGGTGNIINVYGATANGDQADIYGDDGTINLYWANYREEYAVGNGINQSLRHNVMGNLNAIAGQVTLSDFGGAPDVGIARVSASALRASNASSGRIDFEVADEAYNATTWNGSFEVPTKNAIRDLAVTLQPSITATSPITLTGVDIGLNQAANYSWSGTHVYSNTITLGTTTKLQLRDTSQYIQSSAANQLDIAAGSLVRIGQKTTIAAAESASYPYLFNVQDTSSANAYIGIFNSAGADNNHGAFFGLEGNPFALYNWQGSGAGSGNYPIIFYGGFGSIELLRLDRSGGSRFSTNVGIRMAPTEELDVAGDIRASGDITSTDTGALGWSVVDGTDNTACTLQCTSAAVFGFNVVAGVYTNMVGPSDATADICVCAGAS